MFLMYVDESGDTGIANSSTKYYILSGLIVHEQKWNDFLEAVVLFRKHLYKTKKLKFRNEIHASEFVNDSGELVYIKRNDRLDILKQTLIFLNSLPYISIITVRVDKSLRQNSDDVFDFAWKCLIQRFENTINNKNFNGPDFSDDKGIILCDDTDESKLKSILRKMRKINYIPNCGNVPIRSVIEDPVLRDSKGSFFHQLADVIVYFAKQLYQPNKYIKEKSARNYYKRLDNVIIRQASPKNEYGIVEI
jgi:hypothetical protein